VDLVFPRTIQQISQLATAVFPSISPNCVVEELKITGFIRDPVVEHGGRPRIDYFPRRHCFRDPYTPRTLSSAVMEEIKASSPGLKTLIIRNCLVRVVLNARNINIPNTLQKLEFHNCRYSSESQFFSLL
jgi:hypothetical protein